METRADPRKALPRIDEDSRTEFKSIISDGKLGIHADDLLGELSKANYSPSKLFEIAMRNLPADDMRPDKSLAAYFFILSSITELPEDARDFAVDAMVFCENDGDTPTGTIEGLRRQYEHVRALLN